MLYNKLVEEKKQLMKDGGDKVKRSLLESLIADAVYNSTHEKKGKEPADDIFLSLIKKYIDNANVVIENTSADDVRHQAALQEIAILEGYRPKQMTAEELQEGFLHANRSFYSWGSMFRRLAMR